MWVSELHFLPLTQCSTAHSCISCTASLQRNAARVSELHFPAPHPCSAAHNCISCSRSLAVPGSELHFPAPHPCSVGAGVGSDLQLLQRCPCSAGADLHLLPCVLAARLRHNSDLHLLHPILAAWGQICISCSAVHAVLGQICISCSAVHAVLGHPCSVAASQLSSELSCTPSLQRGVRSASPATLSVLGQICISCTPPLHSGVRSASPATLSMHRSSDLHLLHPISAFWGQICISCSAVHAVLGRPRSMGASQLRSASPAPHPCNVGSDLHLLQCGPCSAGADLHLLHPIFAFWGQTSISCNAVHAPQLRSASPAPHLCILGSDQHLL